MTIVRYVHRPKRPPRKKPRPAPAPSVPAIVTAHKRERHGPKIGQEVISDDPEADARIVEFFTRMGVTYIPPGT
jgi:hypothetical protein